MPPISQSIAVANMLATMHTQPNQLSEIMRMYYHSTHSTQNTNIIAAFHSNVLAFS